MVLWISFITRSVPKHHTPLIFYINRREAARFLHPSIRPRSAAVEPKMPPHSYSTSGGVMEGDSEELSPLQKHVIFFDRNDDGIIYPSETFQGFRAIGCGILLSSAAAVFINVGLSRQTRPGKGTSLRFPIEIKNIALAKHGSDSGVYDPDGRFVASKFEEIFTKHAHTRPDALTGKELDQMLKANREPKDISGWVAAFVEWKILYILCKDKDGFLHRDTLRGAYDGSLFYQMEKEHQSSTQKKKKH